MIFEKELNDTYDEIGKLKLEYTLESRETALLVHKLRMYWKPDNIKTVLLAESHVFTSNEDRIKTYKAGFQNSNKLTNYPAEYCRFVYCIGYGERSLYDASDQIENNLGTPQYWKLLNEAAENKFKVTRAKSASERIAQKLELLHYLKENGIWLLDSSIIGIYLVGKKPNPEDYRSILDTSLTNYGVPILKSVNPANIIVIGKSVYNTVEQAISKHLPNSKKAWIHQPNARVTNDQRISLHHITI